MSGHTWAEVGREWDVPRLEAWYRVMGGPLPPLLKMIAAYMGYKLEEPPASSKSETADESAARLLGQLGFHG